MPHIAVKLWPGRSEEEKRAFARAVADDAAPVSPRGQGVGLRQHRGDRAEAWDETVVRPEILEKPDIQYVRSE